MAFLDLTLNESCPTIPELLLYSTNDIPYPVAINDIQLDPARVRLTAITDSTYTFTLEITIPDALLLGALL